MKKEREEPRSDEQSNPAFTEGVEYYFEDGLMVLTAEYLRKRGFCCGSGCRHCPYPRKKQD